MAEHADDVASRLEAAMAAAFDLADELEAISMLSVPNYAARETWAEGRIRLSPAAMRRATTPLGHDGALGFQHRKVMPAAGCRRCSNFSRPCAVTPTR
jgi:hypothetical protein